VTALVHDDLTRCRSCSAVIVWALTREGRLMPVDAIPHERGNLRLRRDDASRLHVEVRASDGQEVRYRPHFATCRDADGWRRR
jgi:hypothetical protein